jgi:hypothetical protein
MSKLNGELRDSYEDRILRLESSYSEVAAKVSYIQSSQEAILDKLNFMFGHIDEKMTEISQTVKDFAEKHGHSEARLVKVETIIAGREKWISVARKIVSALGIAFGGGLITHFMHMWFKTH